MQATANACRKLPGRTRIAPDRAPSPLPRVNCETAHKGAREKRAQAQNCRSGREPGSGVLSHAKLKAALASTAVDGGYTPYQGGTGLIDVDAALDAPVIASGSGDFGMLTWGEEPVLVERTVEFTSRSDAELTVDLEATMHDTTPGSGGEEGPGPLSADVPFDAFTMDAESLSIPAGETRAVTMTVDPAKVPAGTQLSGALVGSVDGQPVTRTALGTVAPESYKPHASARCASEYSGESGAWPL